MDKTELTCSVTCCLIACILIGFIAAKMIGCAEKEVDRLRDDAVYQKQLDAERQKTIQNAIESGSNVIVIPER